MQLNRYFLVMALAMFLSNPIYAQKPEKAKSEKTQCIAMTQKGTRSKLKVVEGSKYCPVHISKDTKREM